MRGSDAAPSPARRRLVIWVILVGVLLMGVAAGAIALYGRTLATRAIEVALGQLGVAPTRIEVRAIGLREMTLGPTQIGGPDGPAASSIEIHWRGWGLLRDVRIDGLTATVTYDGGTIAVAGLPRGENSGRGGFSLPVRQIELTGAKLTIAAADTKLVTALDATIRMADGAMGGYAAIDARVMPEHGTAMRVTANIPEWRLTQEEGRMQFALTRGRFALPEKAVALTNVDMQAATGEAATAEISGELRDRVAPARFPPLAIALQGQREAEALVLTGRAAAQNGALVLNLKGRHALASGRGSLELDTAPVHFKRDGLQPADLFPIVSDALRRVDGAVTARGAVSWGKGLAATAAATFENVGFESGIARVDALNGKVALDSLMPPRTQGVQHVTASLGVATVPPGPVDVRFRLPGDGRLLIDSATYGIAGGKLALADVALAQGQPIDTAVTVQAVDLGAVLTLIDVDGLSGSGMIEGRIPVRVDSSGVVITAGKLVATGPGILRYTGSALPSSGGASNDSLQLVRQALADFHYTELALTLDRAASGEGSLLVNLKGANPAVLDNYPFALNIRLEANFDRLATILFNGYAAAADLLRRSARP